MLKYQTLRNTILLLLIIIILRVKYLCEDKKNMLENNSDICEFINNSDLDKKIAILAAKAELKTG